MLGIGATSSLVPVTELCASAVQPRNVTTKRLPDLLDLYQLQVSSL